MGLLQNEKKSGPSWNSQKKNLVIHKRGPPPSTLSSAFSSLTLFRSSLPCSFYLSLTFILSCYLPSSPSLTLTTSLKLPHSQPSCKTSLCFFSVISLNRLAFTYLNYCYGSPYSNQTFTSSLELSYLSTLA